VLSTLGRVLPVVAPTVLQAITGGRKELGASPGSLSTTPEEDEKLIAAVINRLPQTAPQWFAASTGYPGYRGMSPF
jgi:hypothetical protein